MKRLLISALAFGMLPGNASANNDFLKKIRDGVKSSYPAYVDSNFSGYVSQYFYLRRFDYLNFMQYLAQSSEFLTNRLNDARLKLEKIKNQDIQAQVLGGAVYVFLLRRIENTARDLERLQNLVVRGKSAWGERCNDDGLRYAKYFYNPTVLFPIDQLNIAPSAESYSISVSMGYGGSGQGGSSAPVTQTPITSESDAAIFGGCVGVGAAVGSLFPGPGNVVGAVIGAVVGSIAVLCKHLFGAVAEKQEKWDLLAEIRQFMSGVVKAKAQSKDAAIDEFCQANLDKSEGAQFISSQFDVVEQLTQNRAQQALSVYDQEHKDFEALDTAVRARLLQINDTYLKSLALNFAKSTDLYFSESAKFDQNALAYAVRELFPSMKALQVETKPLKRVALKQATWTAMIRGDAGFGEAVKATSELQVFPFNPGSSQTVRGVWTSVMKQSGKELAK